MEINLGSRKINASRSYGSREKVKKSYCIAFVAVGRLERSTMKFAKAAD